MLKDYQIKPSTTQEVNTQASHPIYTGKKKVEKSKYFLKGPIDWNWICLAAQCNGKALQVALAIQFLSGLNRSNTIKLPNKILRQLGVDRFSKYRAIKQLENEGLILVSRNQGQAYNITVIYQ